MTQSRKKPVKLEFSANLVSANPEDANRVSIRNGSESAAKPPKGAQSTTRISGLVRLRREVKGRAGKPVAVVYGFDDPSANNKEALKELQAKLKTTLACGGTFDDAEGEIILQVDDLVRVRQVLERLGFTVKG